MHVRTAPVVHGCTHTMLLESLVVRACSACSLAAPAVPSCAVHAPPLVSGRALAHCLCGLWSCICDCSCGPWSRALTAPVVPDCACALLLCSLDACTPCTYGPWLCTSIASVVRGRACTGSVHLLRRPGGCFMAQCAAVLKQGAGRGEAMYLLSSSELGPEASSS